MYLWKLFFRHHEWVNRGVSESEKESARLAKYKKIINKLFFLSLTPLRLTSSRLLPDTLFFLLLSSLLDTNTCKQCCRMVGDNLWPSRVSLRIFIFCFGFFLRSSGDCRCGKVFHFRWGNKKLSHFDNYSIFIIVIVVISNFHKIFSHAEIKNSVGSQRCWL